MTLATSQTISGNKTFSGTVNLSTLTANTFLTLDGSKNVVSTSFDTTNIARTNVNNVFTGPAQIIRNTTVGQAAELQLRGNNEGLGISLYTLGTSDGFNIYDTTNSRLLANFKDNGTINELNMGNGSSISSIKLKNSASFTSSIRTTSTAADRIYTIPESGANADFMMTAGNQLITGNKTFSGLRIGDNTINATISVSNLLSSKTFNLQQFSGASTNIIISTGAQTMEDIILTGLFSTTVSTYLLGTSPANLNFGTSKVLQMNEVSTNATANTITARDSNGDIFMNALNATATTNQLILGTGSNKVTINAPAPTPSRTYTIASNIGADADFVMTQGTQTINGTKTLAGTINFSALTANSILALDASKNVVSTAFDTTNIARTNANNVFTGPTQTIRNTTVGQAAELQLRGNNEGLGISLYTLGIADGFNIYDTSNNGRLLANFKDNGAINELNMGNGSSVSSIKLKNSPNFTSSIRTATTTADRIYTIPEIGANADFMMTAGNQVFTGNKTFLGQVIISKYAIATGIFFSNQFVSPNSTDTILFNAYTSNGITSTTFPYSVFDTNTPGVYLITWTLRTLTAPTAETSTWIECSEDTAIKHGLQAIPIGSFYCSSSVLIPLVNSNSNFKVKFFNGNAANITVREIDARLTIRYINSN
jgi:hypothetical protein